MFICVAISRQPAFFHVSRGRPRKDVRLYSTSLILLAVDSLELDIAVVCVSGVSLRYRKRRNIQDEGSVGGDEAREATVTVGVVAVQ